MFPLRLFFVTTSNLERFVRRRNPCICKGRSFGVTCCLYKTRSKHNNARKTSLPAAKNSVKPKSQRSTRPPQATRKLRTAMSRCTTCGLKNTHFSSSRIPFVRQEEQPRLRPEDYKPQTLYKYGETLEAREKSNPTSKCWIHSY